MSPHVTVLGRCFAHSSNARPVARHHLAQLLGRPPHPVEIDAAIVPCPHGTSCPQLVPNLRRTA